MALTARAADTDRNVATPVAIDAMPTRGAGGKGGADDRVDHAYHGRRRHQQWRYQPWVME